MFLNAVTAEEEKAFHRFATFVDDVPKTEQAHLRQKVQN